MARFVVGFVLIAFTDLLLWALWREGFAGMFEMVVSRPMTIAATADLVIALSICCVGMAADARRFGRTATPWIVVTLLTGSIGPLLYLWSRVGWARAESRDTSRVVDSPEPIGAVS